MTQQQNCTSEILKGERFQFGENWKEFLNNCREPQINYAELTLKDLLEADTLEGKTFLDIGSGSGIHSLAACRLGAKVYSFDYDPSSVWCTTQLRNRFFPDDLNWKIEQGSVLDKTYLECLGCFDIVYAWGVLHHTGDLWKAIELTTHCVAPNGILILAIYNDQGWLSYIWRFIKRTYNILPGFLKPIMPIAIGIIQWAPSLFLDLFRGQPFFSWKHYYHNRGMSPWHDVVDWVGGYPFQVARRESVIDSLTKFDFHLQKMISAGRQAGNNQFVFQRNDKK